MHNWPLASTSTSIDIVRDVTSGGLLYEGANDSDAFTQAANVPKLGTDAARKLADRYAKNSVSRWIAGRGRDEIARIIHHLAVPKRSLTQFAITQASINVGLINMRLIPSRTPMKSNHSLPEKTIVTPVKNIQKPCSWP
ncbi:hypothetical protein D3C80_1357200 [compost metagenome]